MKHDHGQAPCLNIAVVAAAPIWCAGFKAMLDSELGLRVKALPLAEIGSTDNIDVVVINGRCVREAVRTIEALKVFGSSVRILVTGPAANDEDILHVLQRGAKGYVNEEAPVKEIAQAIRIVADGLIWSPRRVVAMFIERSGESLARDFLRRTHLTRREKEVLQMLRLGQSNKEIAMSLGIEARTVKSYVSKLKRKTGAENRIALSLQVVTNSIALVN